MINDSILVTKHIINAAFPSLYGGVRQLLILNSPFDESGTHSDSSVVAVAGWLATAEQWNQFTVEWTAALAEWDLEFFHMTDYAQGVGVYESWTQQEKADRLKRLIKIINGNVQGSVARIVVKTGIVSRHNGRADKFYNQVGDWSYREAAVGCLNEAANLSHHIYGETSVRIAYTYESGAFRSDTFKRVFDGINTKPEMQSKYRTVSLIFANKPDFVPLQAADILAYELYLEEDRKLVAKRDGVPRQYPKRKSLIALEQHPYSWAFMGGTGQRDEPDVDQTDRILADMQLLDDANPLPPGPGVRGPTP